MTHTRTNSTHIQTSYFANATNVTNPVSISQYPPDWFDGPRCKYLAPPKHLFRGDPSYSQQYQAMHNEVLNVFTPESLWVKLVDDYGPDITLLCFEVDEEFCHRRIVADFLSGAGMGEVPEAPKVEKVRVKKIRPTSLSF